MQKSGIKPILRKKNKLEYMGTDKESKIWKGLQYDIRNAEEAVKRYESAKRKMEAAGTDVQRPVSLPKQALNFGKVCTERNRVAIPSQRMGWNDKTFGRDARNTVKNKQPLNGLPESLVLLSRNLLRAFLF